MASPMNDDDRPRVLIVDDTPQNLRLMDAVLSARGYLVSTASSGREALARAADDRPDLVLLDVVMPGMDGYEVCRTFRTDHAMRMVPVIMITASGDQQKLSALEAGADDFVQKPFNQAELLARVASLVRIKRYQDTIERQAAELAEWNRTLEARVAAQVVQLDRLGRLKRFLGPRLAEVLISTEGEALLESHRRQIAVLCCQLPGFSALAESAAPEDVMQVLHDYHQVLGEVAQTFELTVGPLVEDRVSMLFNDPLPSENPAAEAVRAALAIRDGVASKLETWRKAGHAVDLGIGIDLGYATLGTVGFEGKMEYGAIGTVVHVAQRLSDMAHDSQILTSQRVYAASENLVEGVPLGDQALPGLPRPVAVYAIPGAGHAGAILAQTMPQGAPSSGPLTEREREVVELIVKGLTNRQIADTLVIAEGTAVRHVANILNKLGLHSRAQVAVWALAPERRFD
jgi:adenylate cyclase